MTSASSKVLQWYGGGPLEIRANTTIGLMVVQKHKHGYTRAYYYTVLLQNAAKEDRFLTSDSLLFKDLSPVSFDTQRRAKTAAERWYKELHPLGYMAQAAHQSCAADRVLAAKRKTRKQHGI